MRTQFRFLGLLAVVACAACGGNQGGRTSSEPSRTATWSVQASSPKPSPLVVPKGCNRAATALEITAVNTHWVSPGGEPYEPGAACLAVPASKSFTVTVHNDPKKSGIFQGNHNFSIYADSSANTQTFYGDLVAGGQSSKYKPPPLDKGVYLFRCDIHPDNMWGVLVAK